MTIGDAEGRRAVVARLLQQGLDSKLLRGGSNEALRLLARARRLASNPDPLPWPWPQLCAYRYAYIKMRMAETQADVRGVLRILDETEAGAWPDPLQHAFLCAVLLRLRSDAAGSAKLALQQRIEETLAAMMTAGDHRHRSLHSAVQTETLNIAELLTFAAGATYRLEGLGRLPLSHVPSRLEDAFVLVGTNRVDADVAMTGSFAAGEFDARVAEADIAFEWIDQPVVVKPAKLKLHADFMRRLPDILQESTLDDAAVENWFEVMISRQRDKVADLLRRTRGLEIPKLETIPLVGARRYAVNPALRVIGLVRLARWRPRAVL